MADETITLLVDDWDAALRAEHDEIVAARGGRPLSSDELAAWLRAVDRRNRAHEGMHDAEGTDDDLIDRRVRIAGTLVDLRLPTLAARIRIEAADRWLAEGRLDGRAHLVLSAYCLAHGHDADAMALLYDAQSARREALRWGSSALTCGNDAIAAARSRLLAGAYDEPDAEDPDDPKAQAPAGPGSPPG